MSKKFRNPISKPQTVTISTWKFEALVASATTLEIVDKLINKLDSYDAKKVLDVLFGEDKEGEE